VVAKAWRSRPVSYWNKEYLYLTAPLPAWHGPGWVASDRQHGPVWPEFTGFSLLLLAFSRGGIPHRELPRITGNWRGWTALEAPIPVMTPLKSFFHSLVNHSSVNTSSWQKSFLSEKSGRKNLGFLYF
jgi:hypothetical protein